MTSQESRRAWWPALVSLLVSSALAATSALACDICAVYTATEMQETRTGIRVGLAEQFTRFTTLQESGREAPNPDRERMTSSITQVLAGYALHPRFAVQVNVPIIHRSYRRAEGSGVVDGDETGIGDIALVSTGQLYSYIDEHSVFRLSGLFGIKLPTGSPKRIAEELGNGSDDGHSDTPPIFQSPRRFYPRHNTGGTQPPSGIHGHDLALGSGSTDILLGAQALATRDRWFATTSLLYSVRTVGAYGYLYADELIVEGGPGFFALLEHDYSLGLQAILTLDSKGNDKLKAERVGDTGYTGLYVGPGLHFTWGTSLSAELVADLPAVQNNSGLQIVPDYRLRGGLVWRF